MKPVIVIYSSAKKHITSFSQREKATWEYLLSLLKSDFDSLRALDIAKRAGDNPRKVEIGVHKVHHAHDRLKFIINTLGLHANIHENEIIVTTIA